MDDISVERLDHHGVVMGVIKDLGIIEQINQRVGEFPDEKLSVGERIALMIINGLGFTDQPLSLMPEFFEQLPLSGLLGRDISSEDFDRFSLSRALDRVYDYGETTLFTEIAAYACQQSGVDTKTQSFDTTSFSFTGEYNDDPEDGERTIRITHGYSKDHRPDLKQIVTELLVSHDNGVPLVMKNWDGNIDDTAIFKKRTEQLVDSFRQGYTQHVTADSKFYTKENAKHWDIVKFTTRVPETGKLAKEKIEQAHQLDQWVPLGSDGLEYIRFETEHYDTQQRWFVCRSQASLARAQKAVDKAIEKEKKAIKQALFHLQAQRFQCGSDAISAATALFKTWRYHRVVDHGMTEHKKYDGRGRPTQDTPWKMIYQINPAFELDETRVTKALNRKASFIIATNTDEDKVSDEAVICAYKNQQCVERGYRFLKDPQFFASAFFLKKPSRISALVMVMTLALLVYSIAQRRLRINMENQDIELPNQIGIPVKRLTLRRAFQMLQGINVVKMTIQGMAQCVIQGITKIRELIIQLIGGECQKIYKIDGYLTG